MEFYEFDDYRDFVRSYFHKRSRSGRGEIVKLANAIRVHPTFVSQVLAGTKDFSFEQSYAIAQHFELTEDETTHFLLLVQKDRAGTKDLKKFWEGKLTKHREAHLKIANRIEKHRTLSDEDMAVFYSSWLHMAVWLCTSLGNGTTLEQICSHLAIGRKKALAILDFLCAKDLCLYEGGRYRMGTQHVHIPNDSPFVIRHHMNWRTKALQRHDQVSIEEIAFTAPVSIARKDFLRIRELLLKSIQDAIEVAKKSDAEDLAFLNIDWLWMKTPNAE